MAMADTLCEMKERVLKEKLADPHLYTVIDKISFLTQKVKILNFKKDCNFNGSCLLGCWRVLYLHG